MTTGETGDLRSAGVVQVLDVGCGVASFSAYLLPFDIQTMSFAPKDGHENQIQFALERGIGAMISVIATKHLPYPSNSFEMVHCSRCRVYWHENGTFLLHSIFKLNSSAVHNQNAQIFDKYNFLKNLAIRKSIVDNNDNINIRSLVSLLVATHVINSWNS